MTAHNWLALSHICSFVGAIIVIASGIGIWHFGNKLDGEKDAKVTELIQGKNQLLEQSNAYLADLRNKDAKIARLKSSLANMDPVLSLLEVQFNELMPTEATLVLGASYPVDLRQVDALIEFTSPIVGAERSVVGSGSVTCNFGDPIVDGPRLTLSGGPLNASNYLLLKITTEARVDIKSSNIRIPKKDG